MQRTEATQRWGVVASILLGGALLASGAETNASRLVDYVAPSWLADQTNAVRLPPRMVLPQELTSIPRLRETRKPSWGERWEKFETEFGVKQKNPSFALNAVEAAKYRLDRTSLTLQQFVETFEDLTRFDYRLSNLGRPAAETQPPRRVHGNPLFDAWENAHFCSDIHLHPTSQPYVGVKLEVPFGN